MTHGRRFLILSALLTALVIGAVWFIQTPGFALIVRRFAARQLPRDLGIDTDFSELSIRVFPPGLSLRQPRVTVRGHNALNLPGGSSVRAERIDLTFRPLRLLAGKIRIHEVAIVNGDIHLIQVSGHGGSGNGRRKAASPGSSGAATRGALQWDDLLELQAESVSLSNTSLRLDRIDGDRIKVAEIRLRSFALRRWEGRGGPGYAIHADVERYAGSLLPEWMATGSADQIRLDAHVNASGVLLDSLSVSGGDHQASISGRISGNVLDPRAELLLDCSIRAHGGLAALVQALPSRPDMEGDVTFAGHVKANPRRVLQTLDVRGQLRLQGFRYRLFRADEVDVLGQWRTLPQGGELSVTRAEVSARDSPRGFEQLARGGKVVIAPFRVVLGSGQAVPLRLQLDKARLQWLAALGIRKLKQVYAVDLAASGPVDLRVTPPWRQGGVAHPFQLLAEPRLTVENFQLDNQHPGERRSLHRVFAIPKIRVEGPIAIGGDGVRFNGVLVSIGQTRLKLAGTINDKAEYGLHATGSVRLAELGTVADNAIRGDGTAEVTIHGPASKLLVDIDLDVKDAYYLHLRLGKVTGRLTWDDDPDHLVFQGIQVTQGTTLVALDGMLRLGKLDEADLKAKIEHGDIHDFSGIFADLTHELSWFPASLSGPFSGDLAIGGGLDLDKLTVGARFKGSDWDYAGERFARVELQGGYDRGGFQVSSFRIKKHGGLLTGHVSVDREKVFDWDFHISGFGLNDFDHVARLDVPIRGKFLVDSTGHGRQGAIRAESTIRVTGVTVRGEKMADSSLIISSMDGIHRVRASLLGSQATLQMDYDFNPNHWSHLSARLEHLDFSPILLLLNPRSIPDSNLAGYVSGSLDLSFRAGGLDRANGVAGLTEYTIVKSGVRFQLDHPVTVRMTDGDFDLPDLSLLGVAGAHRSRATLTLASRKARLSGKVSGDIDLSMLQIASAAVSRATGVARLDFTIGGDLLEPTVRGRAELGGATLWIQGLESPLEHVTGAVEFNQGTIEVRDIESELAGGRFSLTGDAVLFPDHYPKIALRGNFYGNRIKVFPFQYIKIRGPIMVYGDQVPYSVEGNLVVDSAVSREKVFQQKQGGGLKTARYMPPMSREQGGDFPLFKLHVRVFAENGIRVQNELFDAELKAHVTLINTPASPRILGAVDLVRGKMMFNNRAFQLEQASAVFDNPAVINPRINLSGSAEISGIKVQLYVAGTMDHPKVDLNSTPVMSETDILNLLALGMTSRDTQRLSPTDRAMMEQGEAASLLLNSLDFNREVESKTGIQLHLDETVNNLVGASVFRPQAASEIEAAPRIVIRKQITNNVNLSYGSTVGVGSSSDQEATAEVGMTPGVSMIGVWDNYEALDTQDRVTSYGLDLKFQKRFK